MTWKRYEILLLLVENAGRLMLKEEILDRIWPDQYTGEANLANNIHAIRRLIEDDPRQPQLILTIPGQGYRFQGEVKVLDDSSPAENSALDGDDASSPPNEASRKADKWSVRRGRVALVGVVLLLMAVIGGWSVFRMLYPQRQPVPAIPRPLTSFPGPERFPALSSDGRMVAFSWAADQSDNDDIYVKQTVAGEAIRVTTHPASDRKPAWSPDGHYLAFLRAARQAGEPHHLLIIPALGGAEREIARVDDGVEWSPDGQSLAVTGLSGPGGGMGIYLIGVDGQERRRITEHAAEGGFYDSTPRFSPDGRSLAFLRYKTDLLCEIFIADLTNGKIRQVSDNQNRIKSETLHWSPDGQRLYFISNRTGGSHLWQISATGGVAEIVLNLPIPMTSISIARQAQSLVYINEQEDAQIEIFEMNGGGKRACLINSSMADHGAMWSPDGSQVVFTSNQTGWNELWLAQKDCTGQRQLTSFHEIGVGSPRWSPDGRLIAFDRRVNGQSDVYAIQIEDLQLRKVTDSVWSSLMPSWSPDGEWIYFTSNRVQSHDIFQIWKIPARGGEPRQLTFDAQRNSRGSLVSPDGKFLYFNRENRLWRLDLSTNQESALEQLSTHYLTRDWDIARGAIYFLEPDSGAQLRLYRLDLATGNRSLIKELTSKRNIYVPNLSVSPDEQRYALTTISNESSDIMLVEGWR